MAARPQSPRQRQMVHVAMRVLADEGARALTSQRLASELGLTTGAIFRHFESMAAIVGAVVDRMEAALFAGFPPSAADPVERLERFFLERTACIRAHPELSRLLLSGAVGQCDAPREAERVEGFKRRTQAFLRETLSEASAQGRLAPHVSPTNAQLLVVGAVTALAHAGAPGGGHRGSTGASADATEVWATLARALFTASPKAPRSSRDSPARRVGGARRLTGTGPKRGKDAPR